jgi:predicted DNA-binding transcriptional regulator AlpA
MERLLDDDRYMVLSQVAEALGNSEAWVCRLTQLGRLPYKVTPLGRLYLREDVEKFITERKEKETTDA